jgi:hypothetical protein
LDDDFVKHKQDIINEIMRMMTPKGLISEEGLMIEQLNVIANKLAKTAKELIDQDELEIDQTVKIIDDLAKEFRVEMPAEYYFGFVYPAINNRRADLASEVIVQIGPKAIATLNEIAHNGNVNIYINDLA